MSGRSPAVLHVPAFAKINLGLEVLGRRQDGFHELRTLFQTVDLRDDLTLRRRREGITLVCDDPRVPAGPSNLALRAAIDLARYAGVQHGAEIRIRKRVPVAGGLGGGSSNAAAALLGLNRLWGLGLSRWELQPLARRLGADVPFFLVGGTALGIARGDEVFPLRRQIVAHVVVVDPDRPLATGAVFGRVDASLTPRENSITIFRFVSRDLEGDGAFQTLSNDLERAALEEAPDLEQQVRRIRGILVREGASLASLSGSGSSFFGLFGDSRRARKGHAALVAEGFRAHRARTLTLEQYRRIWSRSLSREGRRGTRTG